MKKTLFVLPLIMLLIVSCHKKHENNYSHWVVNTDSFMTNETYTSELDFKPRSDFQTNSYENGFWLTFAFGYLPTDSRYRIASGYPQNPSNVNVGFYYKSAMYNISSSNIYMQISTVDGNIHYSFPKAWYANQNDPNDSVLIQGELVLP